MAKLIPITTFKIALVVAAFLLVAVLLMRVSGEPVSAFAQIDIAAPIETVWQIQMDFAKWQEWNADIQSMDVKGPVQPGTEFVWKAGGISIQSRIQEVVVNSRIVWTGKAFGLNAVHQWDFTQHNGITHVYTQETFSGPMVWLMPSTMRIMIRDALQTGVTLLKGRSEQTVLKTAPKQSQEK